MDDISHKAVPADTTAVVEDLVKVKHSRRFKKILRKIQHHVGLGGHGTTLLDKPVFGKLTWREKKRYRDHIDAVADVHRNCFRRACIEGP